MKLYGCLVLLALVLCATASSQKGSKRSLAEWDNENDEAEEQRREQLRAIADLLSHSKRKTTNIVAPFPLLNLTAINRGLYLSTVKLNFLRNGSQTEYETDSFGYGKNRVFYLQKFPSDIITYVRVRFHVVGTLSLFGDFQIRDPTQDDLCFVLSGTVGKPVYSLCADDEDYTRK